VRLKYLLLLAPALFLNACAHRWSPGNAPPIPMETVPQFSEKLSVELVNDQPDTEWKLFAGVGGHTHYANYNEWTQFFVNYWSEELTKRGAEVSPESKNKILVKLDHFQFFQGFAKVRTNFSITLTNPDGSWKKEYEETDTSGWSMGRAFGSLIHHSVMKLMMDPDVLDRMK